LCCYILVARVQCFPQFNTIPPLPFPGKRTCNRPLYVTLSVFDILPCTSPLGSVCVCVCVREREWVRVCVWLCDCACACVCACNMIRFSLHCRRIFIFSHQFILERFSLEFSTHVCNTLPHSATLCHTLQHTATLCNTLQHFVTLCNTVIPKYV